MHYLTQERTISHVIKSVPEAPVQSSLSEFVRAHLLSSRDHRVDARQRAIDVFMADLDQGAHAARSRVVNYARFGLAVRNKYIVSSSSHMVIILLNTVDIHTQTHEGSMYI